MISPFLIIEIFWGNLEPQILYLTPTFYEIGKRYSLLGVCPVPEWRSRYRILSASNCVVWKPDIVNKKLTEILSHNVNC